MLLFMFEELLLLDLLVYKGFIAKWALVRLIAPRQSYYGTKPHGEMYKICIYIIKSNVEFACAYVFRSCSQFIDD